MFKKRIKKSIVLGLVGVTVATPLFNIASAMEKEGNNNSDLKTTSSVTMPSSTLSDYSENARIGGGDSPSLAWTYKSTNTKTFTRTELDDLNKKLQAAVKSGKKTQKACDAANFMVSFMGKPGVAFSLYLTFIATSQPDMIQDSANTVSRALSKGGSVKLKVKVYERPASGQTLVVYSDLA